MTANRYRFQNPSLLGTVVEFAFDVVDCEAVDAVAVESGDQADGDMAEQVADHLFAEFDRLQAVFSAFDPTSELCRWRRGELPGSDTSEGFAELMAEVLTWQRLSGGLFNPLAGELSAVWAAAEADDRHPDPSRLIEVATSIARPRFEMVDGRPEPVGDCSRLNLNAVAKGWIVELAVASTVERFDGIDNLLVNAGGDLRHHGRERVRIGIENPHRPYDNEPPLVVIEVDNEAVATSGGGRRGFTIGGRTVSHVLDPRTGQPAQVSASVSIVAPTAMIADVAATPSGILPPDAAVDFLDDLEAGIGVAVAGLIIDDAGDRHASRHWHERFGSPPGS